MCGLLTRTISLEMKGATRDIIMVERVILCCKQALKRVIHWILRLGAYECDSVEMKKFIHVYDDG